MVVGKPVSLRQKSAPLPPPVAATYERLTSNSASRLAEIDTQCSLPPWSVAVFTSEFSNKCSLVFGASVGSELVGFLVCHAIYDEAHVVNFGVLEAYRSRGIGRGILDFVLRDLHLRGVRWITLEVRRTNHAALALYQSMGFSEVGIREKYYSDNLEDALVLSLNLLHYVDSQKVRVAGNF